MTQETAPAQERKPRWVWPVLFLSLAANLLVIGTIAGAMIAGGSEKAGRPEGPARSFLGEPFLRSLEPEDRRALGREILANRVQLREGRAEIRKRADTLIETLSAEEFDRDAVSELLSEQRGFITSFQEFGEVLLLNRLEAMTLEERQGYAERLKNNLRRRSRR